MRLNLCFYQYFELRDRAHIPLLETLFESSPKICCILPDVFLEANFIYPIFDLGKKVLTIQQTPCNI